MSKACEETKHFHTDHSQPGNARSGVFECGLCLETMCLRCSGYPLKGVCVFLFTYVSTSACEDSKLVFPVCFMYFRSVYTVISPCNFVFAMHDTFRPF